MKQLPQHIIEWLNSRNINQETIERARIDYKNSKIVIPVFNSKGSHRFNKYRRDPMSTEDVPKYSYDSGSITSLYNINNISKTAPTRPLIICEGELDALVLMAHGYDAVSSTSGAGSFKKEWVEPLLEYNRQIYICYDNDTAGRKGALKVQQLLPDAKTIWLPFSIGDHGDITDYFKVYSKDDFNKLIKESVSYPIPTLPPIYISKKELDTYKRNVGESLDWYIKCLREAKLKAKREVEYEYLILAKEMVKSVYDDCLSRQSAKKIKVAEFGSTYAKKEHAKMVSIENIIKFNGMGNAKCIWHDEKTPSMHYYKQSNKVKCFGCGASGDSIDVYMKLHNCSMTEAIAGLLSM